MKKTIKQKTAKKTISKTIKQEKVESKIRPNSLTVASLLFALSALINLSLFIYITLVADKQELALTTGYQPAVGLLPLALGLLDITAAIGLWNMKKFGAIVGLLDLAASISIGFFPPPTFSYNPSYDPMSLFVLGLNLIMAVIVLAHYKKLK